MRLTSKFSPRISSSILITSLFACLKRQPSHAFAQVGGQSFVPSTTNPTTFNPRRTSIHRNMSSTTNRFPDAISVQPGTSPIESQEKKNPIDESCTILIVGANRGIGLEFVQQCLKRNANVIATYRSDEVPTSLAELMNEYPNLLHPLQMDIGNEQSIQNAALNCKSIMEDCATNQMKLTHIIHNAGIYLTGSSFDGTARGPRDATPPVTKDVMMKTFEINTIAPLLVAQNFVPLLSKRSDSKLAILSMLSSKVGSVDDNGSGGAYAYRSSKSALNNIAKSLSIDLGGEVSVVLLHPGYVRTDMTNGNGLIDACESVAGMLHAIEATDATVGFRFVDYKGCLIPW